MAELHPLVSFFAGDQFEIDGSVCDDAGNPIPLGNVQSIEWKLATLARVVVLDYALANNITIVDAANGLIRIVVPGGPNSDSANLVPQRYRDQLRVTTSTGVLSTQWVGFIDVKQPL